MGKTIIRSKLFGASTHFVVFSGARAVNWSFSQFLGHQAFVLTFFDARTVKWLTFFGKKGHLSSPKSTPQRLLPHCLLLLMLGVPGHGVTNSGPFKTFQTNLAEQGAPFWGGPFFRGQPRNADSPHKMAALVPQLGHSAVGPTIPTTSFRSQGEIRFRALREAKLALQASGSKLQLLFSPFG